MTTPDQIPHPEPAADVDAEDVAVRLWRVEHNKQLCREAAATIVSRDATMAELRSQLTRAREALKPFADLAEAYEKATEGANKHRADEGFKPMPPHSDGHRISISLGECRRARSLTEGR